MKRHFKFSSYLGLIFLFTALSCKNDINSFAFDYQNHIHKGVDNVTNVIIHDIFSPPVASRIYMYSSIAAYEATRYADSSLVTLSGQIPHMPDLPQPEQGVVYDYELAGLTAFHIAAKKFVFSEDSIMLHYNDMLDQVTKSGLDNDIKQRSISFGESVGMAVGKWADGDNYAQSRSYPKFAVMPDSTRWRPTPPAYMDAIEPHWRTIRTLTLDSAAQFKPVPPTKFNMNKNSQFFKETMEVYDSVNQATEKMREIANFWDCNPYKMNVIGHVMHATKKITPGGHWMGITGIAARNTNATSAHTWKAYALTAIGLFDGFISCWDEKYRSNLIRPETVINKYIDENWQPILQTPPFPEYTSGHSVVSGASSVILTHIFGENFAFSDDTETRYGLPIRDFSSFSHAASEAAVSRLYGGIHYRPAIANGLDQGKNVGKHVISRIKTNR